VHETLVLSAQNSGLSTHKPLEHKTGVTIGQRVNLGQSAVILPVTFLTQDLS
jgi:acetyltransferase-like isoleucine patch superfamily enzyme